MVSLLQKLWGSGNSGVDTPRAPSALRARTLPTSRRRKTSCWPQLEALEDRLTSAAFWEFAPVAHVAVNPQPLPPSALIEFNPLMNLGSATPGTSTQQEQIVGTLSKQITIPAATAGTPGQMWNLDVVYNLTGTATGTYVPPSPTAAGSDNVTFRLAGTVDETLAPVAPTTGAA
jgi:hypothetical protein